MTLFIEFYGLDHDFKHDIYTNAMPSFHGCPHPSGIYWTLLNDVACDSSFLGAQANDIAAFMFDNCMIN